MVLLMLLHTLLRQAFFSFPRPPYFFLSLQCLQQPKSLFLHPSQSPHLYVHAYFLYDIHKCIQIHITKNTICDQICQKGSYTCTVSGLTFHHHSTDKTIDQQFMLVPLPNLQWSAFTEASFTGLCGVHGCSGGLSVAPTCLARQTDGRESLQDWLVRLGIDVATFCYMWS